MTTSAARGAASDSCEVWQREAHYTQHSSDIFHPVILNVTVPMRCQTVDNEPGMK